MLNAMLKFPQICEQYRRISKKKMTQDEVKEAMNQATLTLRQYKLDENPTNTNNQLEKLVKEIQADSATCIDFLTKLQPTNHESGVGG